MKWHDVLDIGTRGKAAVGGEWAEPGLFVRVLSDFDEAPVGVVSAALPARDFVPVLEKQLRDTGVTETVSSVVAHEVYRGGDLARVFYTAIPIASRLRRQRWHARGQHVFVFPVAALLGRVVTATRGLAAAVLVKPGAALVIVANGGQVRLAEWFALSGALEDDARRLAEIVRRDLLGEASESEVDVEGIAVSVFHADGEKGNTGTRAGAESTAQALHSLLRSLAIPPHLGALAVKLAPAAALLRDAKLEASIQGELDRVAYFAERCLPGLAAVMAALFLWSLSAMFSAAGDVETQREAYRAVQQRVGADDRNEIARLSALEIERTNGTAKLQELLSLHDKAARSPDLRRVLQDIRLAVPESVRIAEIGVAADDDVSMIFVNGSMQWSGQVLADEQRLVAALEDKGYVVKQRDFFSAATSSGFRLALTWGSR
jgi:hypothetical protein